MAKKFIITGGPCTGKTSIISELGREFRIFKEAAREVYNSEERDITSENFQKAIFEKQLENEEQVEKYPGVIFFDRGLADTVAYYKYYGFEVPEELLQKCKNADYEIIFFLDFVPYEKDKMRYEDKEEAKKIHELIYNSYKDLGYKIVKVPLMSVKERAEFIKKFID
ncbi:AAA family ATPase [Candidatus Pacearchaeota archaeon]|nr:AAA family ATPase [Candidatus Pacearchaeota archaeon]MBD3283545.1 AAA family ATPase [Candidatus Pacearchaeota archaeon]